MEATAINKTNQTGTLGKYLVAASDLGGFLLPVLLVVHMTPHINHHPIFLKRVLGSFATSI